MKRIIFIVLLVLLFTNGASSQKGLNWMPLYERSVLDSAMNIHYTHNDNFTLDTTLLSIWTARDNIRITSKDGNFTTFLQVDIPYVTGIIDSDTITYPMQIVFFANGKNIVEDRNDYKDKWKDFVYYFSDSDAKEKFNADMALYIQLPANSYYSFEKYTQSKFLIIHKTDQRYLAMLFLCTDDAKEKFDEYIAAIENSFRYGNDPPAKMYLDMPPPFFGRQKREVSVGD